MVPVVGVEPTRLSAQDFESCVSTISPHRHRIYFTIIYAFLQVNNFTSIFIDKMHKILYNKLVLKLTILWGGL